MVIRSFFDWFIIQHGIWHVAFAHRRRLDFSRERSLHAFTVSGPQIQQKHLAAKTAVPLYAKKQIRSSIRAEWRTGFVLFSYRTWDCPIY